MLKIYNTQSRQKEEFKPIIAGKINMYVCGMTVYDYCHIGHARFLITFDMIYRALKHLGFDVTYARNFTDVDDKIIKRANERGIDSQELAEEFIQAFHDDTHNLKLLPPTIEPKATEHIPEMLAIIAKLIEQGNAYEAGGDVFFAVRKFKEYGKLSGKNIEDLESGARVDILEAKRDPLDFALWKAAKPGEPFWESPWGKGRPGWHIECSAMSMKYLGETFDIHGGGRDLVFPHHENEVAQSEACTHKVFARYWLHNGFLNINSVKMSKSLNNFVTIRDILKSFPAEALRLFMLSAHYRSPIDYTDKNIQDALTGLERFYVTKKRFLAASVANDGGVLAALCEKLGNDFSEAMADDFNTAKIVGGIFELVRELNKHLDESKPVSEDDKQAFLKLVNAAENILGVFGSDADAMLAEIRHKSSTQKGVSADVVEQKIAERVSAKKNRDFKTADALRDELKAMGVQIKDNPDGTTSWSMM